jgi:hypothetical protein
MIELRANCGHEELIGGLIHVFGHFWLGLGWCIVVGFVLCRKDAMNDTTKPRFGTVRVVRHGHLATQIFFDDDEAPCHLVHEMPSEVHS